MKLKYYQQTNHHIWCILESELIGPKWSIIDCYDKAYIGMEYKDLNEFLQIHLGFIEDQSYRLNVSKDTSNDWKNLKPDKVTPYRS